MDLSLKLNNDFLSKLLGNLKSFSFANQKQSFLGVDIGSSSIKIVQLRKEKERAILETYGEVATGPYAKMRVGQNVRLQPEAAAEAIKDLLKESNAKAKTARIAIPLRSSFVKVISLPFASDKNMSEIITMEARRHIPVPVSEVTLDWLVIPKISDKDGENPVQNRKETTEVLIVAIHNDVISEYKTIMGKAGLEASAYEIESFSMIRSAIGRGSSTIAVIDFGAATTKLAIVDYGVMRGSHLISKGSQDITLALSQSLGVDFSKAEEIKREIGLSELPEHKEISEVMEPMLDYIFHEASSFIKEFQAKHGRTVSKVVFTGGGSLLKGISNFGIKRLTLEVEYADSFSKLEHPAFLSQALRSAGMNFSVAIGLAMGEM